MRNLLNSIIAGLAIAVIDVVCIILAFSIAIGLRGTISRFVEIPGLTTNDFMLYVVNNWWVVPLYLAVFWINGLYTKHRPFWQETRKLTSSIALAALFVYSIISLGKLDIFISRILFVLHPLILLVLIPLARRIFKSVLYAFGYWKTEVIELNIDTKYTLTPTFTRNTFIGYDIVSSLTVSTKKHDAPEIIEQLKQIRKKFNTETILVVVPDFSSRVTSEVVERLYFVFDHVLVVPEFMELDVLNADVYHLMYENLFVFDINKGLTNPINRAIKRLFDIVFALIGIIVLSPVLFAAGFYVLLRDGFPVILRQQRFGRNGKIFTFYKFRSMLLETYPDENVDRVEKYIKNDPVKQELWKKFRKLEDDPNDPRLIPGINILRKTSIDELAQLVNVLKGDMSLVGPRPFMIKEKDLMGAYFDRVLAAKPGITDLWTVSGRDALSFEKRLIMGTWYIQNWSLWLGLIIVSKTVQQVILYFYKWFRK